ELGFMFGTMRVKGAAPFFGSGKAAEELSDAMMDAWLAFAKTGDPSSNAEWQPYDAVKRMTMIFGDGAPHTVAAPNEERRRAWSAIAADKIGP
ncbi:MAG TPA: hypothetical protein VKT24_02705, partial [Rhizomicrobium sp.]|nr:hypothetical protein [Rhizomicrobium sp.]